MTIPCGSKLTPPVEVEQERLGQLNELVRTGSSGAEVNCPQKECAAGWDDLSDKVHGAD